MRSLLSFFTILTSLAIAVRQDAHHNSTHRVFYCRSGNSPPIQQVIGSKGQSLHRWTLDDIVTSHFGDASKCCPKGTQFDGERCVLDGLTCDTGKLVDGKCVTNPICPVGQWNGQFCVSTEGRFCPDGLKPSGNTCVYEAGPICKDGSKPDGDVCVSKGTPKCENTDDEFKGGVCVSINKPVCKDGSQPSGGMCVSEKLPICAGDSTWALELKKCISTTPPTCKSGKFDNGLCVSDAIPNCADEDNTFNPKTGFCHSDTEPACGDDTELQDGICIGTTKPACKDGYHYSYDLASQTGQCCSPWMSWDGEVCYRYSTSQSGECPPDTTRTKNNRCEKPSGGHAFCPPGLRESKGQCVARGPFCPPSTHYEARLKACVEDETPACPDKDSKLENGKCVLKTTPECPKGSRQEGNYCVNIIKPYCEGEEQGTVHFDGTQCVSNELPECENTDFNFDGEECITGRKPVCDEANGFFLQGGRCVSTKTPECPDDGKLTANGECVSRSKPKCKTGNLVGKHCVVGSVTCPKGTWDGKHCVTEDKIKCPPNHSWVACKNKCVSFEKTECGPGYYEKNGECVSKNDHIRCDDGAEWDPKTQTCLGTKPECPEGSVPEGGECVAQEIPKCPDPERFEFNGKKCVLKKGPDCAPGFRLDGTECVSEKGPVCGFGQVPKDGRCVLASGDCMEFEFCPTYKPLL